MFHKYDGFIYPKPGKISLDRFFPFGSAIEDRKVFFLKFLPKWSGFHVDPFDSKIELEEALYRLDRLVDGITFLRTSTSGYVEHHRVDSFKLGLGKVCLIELWVVYISQSRNRSDTLKLKIS